MTTIDLRKIRLAKGAHARPEDGMCIMEAASMLAGQPFSDAPQCVAPSIRAFAMRWNDELDDKDRTRLLRPFVRKVLNTNTGNLEHETVRAWLACDWLVRTFAPAWLRRAGLDDAAAALEALPELTSAELARAAMPAITRARKAGDAAWDAAGAAAGDAAWAAAWAAAGAAAGDAAGAVAGAAAWAAAGAAAGAALDDTVKELQQSACALLDRMCAVGR